VSQQQQLELFDGYNAKPRYDLHVAPISGRMCNILTYNWQHGHRLSVKGPCEYPGRRYKVNHMLVDICLLHATQLARHFDIDVAPAAMEH